MKEPIYCEDVRTIEDRERCVSCEDCSSEHWCTPLLIQTNALRKIAAGGLNGYDAQTIAHEALKRTKLFIR